MHEDLGLLLKRCVQGIWGAVSKWCMLVHRKSASEFGTCSTAQVMEPESYLKLSLEYFRV